VLERKFAVSERFVGAFSLSGLKLARTESVSLALAWTAFTVVRQAQSMSATATWDLIVRRRNRRTICSGDLARALTSYSWQ
jgi:hypothetical protein